MNCAAIPAELVESELFGVERGAYTGAQAARAGRFERADGGSLFLDEIGDLPLPAQSKLLRVLQDGELERVGDHRTRRVNVRMIAATNADLHRLVKEGRFRSDLYYRLNPFQIQIPPLRERKEDISFLAKRFLEKHCAIHGKKLRGFTDKAKRALLTYRWPGNIRELQNMIERGVILAPERHAASRSSHLFSSPCADGEPQEFGLGLDGNLDVDTLGHRQGSCAKPSSTACRTLDQVEAMLIETAVDKAHGNLSAASRMLGLTRPQLAYRLKRLHETVPARRRAERAASRGRLAMALNLPAAAADYLAQHHVMTLATQGGDGPWAAAVFYVRDGDDLIFLSSPVQPALPRPGAAAALRRHDPVRRRRLARDPGHPDRGQRERAAGRRAIARAAALWRALPLRETRQRAHRHRAGAGACALVSPAHRAPVFHRQPARPGQARAVRRLIKWLSGPRRRRR